MRPAWLTLMLGACFVQPPPDLQGGEPSAEVLAAVDAARDDHLRADPGAELWRALDAHGGLIRWLQVGEPVVTLADGRTLAADDPDRALLLLPFTAQGASALAARRDGGADVTAGDLTLHLHPTSRRVTAITRSQERCAVDEEARVERLWLIRRLRCAERTLEVRDYAFGTSR